MRVTGKLIWPFIFALAFIALSRVFILGATPAETVDLLTIEGNYVVDGDDETPDVTARVARISFLKGSAQIRRADGGDWENATLNLPVVEGDEITTSADARAEIQFDNDQHLRLAENAFLKIVTLKDEGIALSLSLGTASVTITRFDKGNTFFEIDAPKTTIAIEKAGAYRVDAGQTGDADVRVSVFNDGEARVYSETSGFALRSGRSSLIHTEGANAGEWEMADATQFATEFDSWSSDRDSAIAQRLKDAFYDKYYDNDIYGADDLNGYGEWIDTTQYGHVWRPYSQTTSYYSSWSPYRYGSWRWVPPYGWTWVNDEPWGWATYHHGRWFYDAGYWYWSPYGYYRHHRSWWFPALVVLSVYDDNYCWYPLPYHYAYYNFNYYYNSHHHGWGHGGHHNGGGHVQPTPIQTGGIKVPHQPAPPRIKIPPSAVVAMGLGDFGGPTKTVKSPPLAVANAVLTKKIDDLTEPRLPAYSAISKKIAATTPKAHLIAAQTKVGAAPRKADAPLDKELRNTRILGGREPLVINDAPVRVKPSDDTSSEPRKTGAVTRQPPVSTSPPIRQAPINVPPTKTQDDGQVSPVKTTRTDPSVRQVPRTEPSVRQPPRSEPAPTRQPPREPAPTKQPSPTKSEPGKSPPTKAPGSGSSKAQEG